MNQRFGGLWRWLLAAVVAVGAIVIFATGGNGGGIGLWLLLVLACPLMMLFMMGSMQHQPNDDSAHNHMASDAYTTDLTGLSHDEQVRALRNELTRMNWRQETLRQDLERLEREQPVDSSPTGGVR